MAGSHTLAERRWRTARSTCFAEPLRPPQSPTGEFHLQISGRVHSAQEIFMLRNFTVLILIAVLSAACAPAAPQGQAVSLTDGMGRTVPMTLPARRVVSLAPSNTEMLYAVGA